MHVGVARDGLADTVAVVVRGVVQGVGFRYFVAAEGRRLGLSGYAANLADNRSVGVVASGARQHLEAMIECLRRGPPSARIDSVEARWGEDLRFVGPRVVF